MIRKIIQIDEEKCDGCGDCVPSCAEGALQIIDDKVRLISDLFCDGLGACIGYCPQSALTIEEREAESYDENKVMEYIVKGGPNVIKAHLEHLKEHDEFEFLKQAIEYLEEKGIKNPLLSTEPSISQKHLGCPGSHAFEFNKDSTITEENGKRVSHLTQWPIQLHLVSPVANYYQNSHLLLAADCCAFAYPDFHKDFLKEKSLAIACPKLDTNQQIYIEKLVQMINDSEVISISVLVMQVPCCSGLVHLAQQAVQQANRQVPVTAFVIGVNGEVLKELPVC